jgi:hypothetical protein
MSLRVCVPLLLVLGLAGDPAPASAQHPFRGSLHWVVLLCRYSDAPPPTRSIAYFDSLFARPGAGGLADYWGALSRGGVTTREVSVHGWYTVARVTETARNNRDRNGLFNECVSAASAGGYSVPAGYSIAVVTNPGVDLWGGSGRAFFAQDSELGAFSHEVGHGLGFSHSFSDDPLYKNADWSQIGEYDDQWDAMSYANAFGMPTAAFGFGAPGINGPHLDRMGWLPRDEVLTVGSDGATSATVTLRSLYDSSPGGTRLVRVPFDPSDPFHYFTVERRRAEGWDGGFAAEVVLIHEVKKVGDTYLSFLLRERGGNRDPVQAVSNAMASIRVTGPGTVTITSAMAEACIAGYVWRMANSADHVCVTPTVRDLTQQDNAQQPARHNPSGPYGPESCVFGMVWRDAFPNDHACVTIAMHEGALQDNRLASTRLNPARVVLGPNACAPGLVWREADGMDYVCVWPATRDETRAENAAAASHLAGGGSCAPGYVWREAFPLDRVCVIPSSRARARTDNSQAGTRLRQP